jgi:hypothetical protein
MLQRPAYIQKPRPDASPEDKVAYYENEEAWKAYYAACAQLVAIPEDRRTKTQWLALARNVRPGLYEGEPDRVGNTEYPEGTAIILEKLAALLEDRERLLGIISGVAYTYSTLR